MLCQVISMHLLHCKNQGFVWVTRITIHVQGHSSWDKPDEMDAEHIQGMGMVQQREYNNDWPFLIM